MQDIVFSTVTELATAIRAGQVSAVEVLAAHLAQIEKHNSTLNAVVTLDEEAAYQCANEADEALVRGENWGPLHGVPMTLKDGLSTAGMRTTAGFPPLTDYVPTEDSTAAARVKSAGAIVFGKTNVPVMLEDLQTNNPIFGRSNNPWNIERTTGSSSGGAAAAVASGMVPCEIGSDIGGSIRQPAHYCGILGLKPTEHRVSLAGHIPGLPNTPRAVRIMASIGPMARTVDDLILLYQIIAGPDGRDTDVPSVPVKAVPETNLKDIRIAIAPTFPGYPVSIDIREAIETLTMQLEPHSQVVEMAPVPNLNYDREQLSEPVALAISAFNPKENQAPVTLAEYFEALQRRDQHIIAWEQFFDAWDVLICPASVVTAFPHCETGTSLLVDGQEVAYRTITAHCKPFNYTGHPALVIPYKLGRDGLPIGVQIASKRWSESRLLSIAKAISTIIGPFQRPPGY